MAAVREVDDMRYACIRPGVHWSAFHSENLIQLQKIVQCHFFLDEVKMCLILSALMSPVQTSLPKTEGQGLSPCVYPEAVDEERDGCEEDGEARSLGGRVRCSGELARWWGWGWVLCASGADCGGETEWSQSR